MRLLNLQWNAGAFSYSGYSNFQVKKYLDGSHFPLPIKRTNLIAAPLPHATLAA